jgi:hypothetical protein
MTDLNAQSSLVVTFLILAPKILLSTLFSDTLKHERPLNSRQMWKVRSVTDCQVSSFRSFSVQVPARSPPGDITSPTAGINWQHKWARFTLTFYAGKNSALIILC